MIVAIDGPAGAGKSTVSQAVARNLGIQLLDTGAIYRTVAWFSHREGADWQDAEAVAEVASRLQIRFEMNEGTNEVHARLLDNHGVEGIWLNLSTEIRRPEISQGASKISAHPPVRAALLELQRQIGNARSSVVEGRDIGTVVFPGASCKIFLTASPLERATRRRDQLLQKTDEPTSIPDLSTIEAEIRERDERDRNRPVAPLVQAEDAVLVDSTGMTQTEVIEKIVQIANQKA